MQIGLLSLVLAGVSTVAASYPNTKVNRMVHKTSLRLKINTTDETGPLINLMGAGDIKEEADALDGRVSAVVHEKAASDTIVHTGDHMTTIANGSTVGEIEADAIYNMSAIEIMGVMKEGECPEDMKRNVIKILCDGEVVAEDEYDCVGAEACLDFINIEEPPFTGINCAKLTIKLESDSIDFDCHVKAAFHAVTGTVFHAAPKVSKIKDVQTWSLTNWVGMGGKDPHLRFADGGEADFRGANDSVYSILSAPGISFGLRTTDSDHLLPTLRYPKLVHGSFFTGAFWTLKSAAADETNGRAHLYLYYPADGTGVYVREVLDDMQIAAMESAASDTEGWMHAEGGRYDLGAVHVESHRDGRQLSVRAHGWEMNVTRSKIYNCYHCGSHDNRVDFTMRPLDGTPYEAKYGKSHMEKVAPHGLVGQSYDGDNIAVDGAKDDYHVVNPRWTVINTTAQLEGAIEGKAADYVLSPPFAPTFKYSRFDATAAPPRDISKLTGRKRRVKHHAATVGSSEPLQPPEVEKLIGLAAGDKPADKSVEIV